MSKRYTIAVDFDGVLHSYTSPWKNARTIPDPPVPGAMEWLWEITKKFDVAIHSTRNTQFLGKWAMRGWIHDHLYPVAHQWAEDNGLLTSPPLDLDYWSLSDPVESLILDVTRRISYPKGKPIALVYLDDRAWRFEGSNFPTAREIHRAHPWNHRKAEEL